LVENLPWTACVLAPDDEIEDRSVAGNSDLDEVRVHPTVI
jgi:hypothetical protein